MIKSFKHKGLKKFFNNDDRSGITPSHADKIALILDRLDVAKSPNDMFLPGFDCHQLKGNRYPEWAVTVQANWRITFIFKDNDAVKVNYEDYH